MVLHFIIVIWQDVRPLVLGNQILSRWILHHVTGLQFVGQLTIDIHAHIEQVILLFVQKRVASIQLLISLNLLSSITLCISRYFLFIYHPNVVQKVGTLIRVFKDGQFLESSKVAARVCRLAFLTLGRLLHLHLLLTLHVLCLQFGSRLRLSVQSSRCNLLLTVSIKHTNLVLLKLSVIWFNLIAHSTLLNLGET